MMTNFKIILFCQLLVPFAIGEAAKEIQKKELDRLEYLLERLEKDVSGIKDNEQMSNHQPSIVRKEKIVEALNSLGDANKLNNIHAKSTTDGDTSENDDLHGDSSTQSPSQQPSESSPAETTTTTTNPTQPTNASAEPPYITPTPSPSQSSNVSGPASGDGDSGEVELVKPLKSLLDALRKKIASHCAVVDDRCGFHHGKMECCPGLRCSSDWSGTCLVDCVAAGQSCRQNWFCCDGRQCTKVATDDGSEEYACK